MESVREEDRVPAKFDLAELIDYETQTARDMLDSPETLKAREVQLRASVLKKSRAASLLSWIRYLQNNKGPWPGTKAQKAYDLLAFVAIVLGLLSGTGLIQGLLHYDGSQPVNVIPIVAIYGLLQIFLLLNYIFKAFVYRLFKRLPGGVLLYFIREAATRWMERRGDLFGPESERAALLKTLGQRLKQLHRRVLQNHGWKIIQDFGIACHAASLVTFVALIFFNDYTFGWRTTLHLPPETLHRITEALSWPFSWMGEFTRPSLEVIQNSQFSRFEKGFVSSTGIDLGARSTAAWWPFLALTIAIYGLLPRVIMWIILQLSITRTLRTLPFDDFQSEALWRRLSEVKTSWETDRPLEPGPRIAEQTLHQLNGSEVKDCVLFLWRDFPGDEDRLKKNLSEVFAFRVTAILKGSGRASDSEALLSALKQQKTALLIIVTDPWELPGEAIEKIRAHLRAEGHPRLPVLFAPLSLEAERYHLRGDPVAWRHALQAFRDPYLGLLEDQS